MKSSWKKQRLATKKKHIKVIRNKKTILKHFGITIAPLEKFTISQITKGFKIFERALINAIENLKGLAISYKNNEVKQ